MTDTPKSPEQIASEVAYDATMERAGIPMPPRSDEAPVMPTLNVYDCEELHGLADQLYREHHHGQAHRVRRAANVAGALVSGTLATYNPATERVVSVEELRELVGHLRMNNLPGSARQIEDWLSL